jgi:hypothetical protein
VLIIFGGVIDCFFAKELFIIGEDESSAELLNPRVSNQISYAKSSFLSPYAALAISYFTLAKQLENSNMGHASVEWFERSLSVAKQADLGNVIAEIEVTYVTAKEKYASISSNATTVNARRSPKSSDDSVIVSASANAIKSSSIRKKSEVDEWERSVFNPKKSERAGGRSKNRGSNANGQSPPDSYTISPQDQVDLMIDNHVDVSRQSKSFSRSQPRVCRPQSAIPRMTHLVGTFDYAEDEDEDEIIYSIDPNVQVRNPLGLDEIHESFEYPSANRMKGRNEDDGVNVNIAIEPSRYRYSQPRSTSSKAELKSDRDFGADLALKDIHSDEYAYNNDQNTENTFLYFDKRNYIDFSAERKSKRRPTSDNRSLDIFENTNSSNNEEGNTMEESLNTNRVDVEEINDLLRKFGAQPLSSSLKHYRANASNTETKRSLTANAKLMSEKMRQTKSKPSKSLMFFPALTHEVALPPRVDLISSSNGNPYGDSSMKKANLKRTRATNEHTPYREKLYENIVTAKNKSDFQRSSPSASQRKQHAVQRAENRAIELQSQEKELLKKLNELLTALSEDDYKRISEKLSEKRKQKTDMVSTAMSPEVPKQEKNSNPSPRQKSLIKALTIETKISGGVVAAEDEECDVDKGTLCSPRP